MEMSKRTKPVAKLAGRRFRFTGRAAALNRLAGKERIEENKADMDVAMGRFNAPTYPLKKKRRAR